MLKVQRTLNCRGKLLDLSEPKVMGIINVTPDSFYDGGFYFSMDEALHLAEKMLVQGAAILDVGGVSTRPGAPFVSADEEMKRILPVIEALHLRFPEVILSIDTFRSEVAEKAVHAGASIVNDISAGSLDEKMFDMISKLNVPYIVMHMQGIPETMQKNPQYDDVVKEVFEFLKEKILRLQSMNVHDVCIDPGFGFGKTVEHNFKLLKNLSVFSLLGKPVLAGISRKSMICRVLNVNPIQALNGTTALHMIALQQGANILRVHDVKEANECIKLFETLKNV